jgi:nitroreductase family protein
MKRSDTDIRHDVEAELQWDPSIDDRKTGSTKLNRRRYPAMELEEAITGRRSVREFTHAAVDPVLIEQLIDAAVQAPSAMNRQPWLFTVVRDQGELYRISHEAKRHMLATSEVGKESDHLHALLSDPNFHIFYHAPSLILISAREAAPWALEDCALAAQNLMLKAHALALGTCWIGFAQSFLNTPLGKAILRLPSTCLAVAPIIVGHSTLAAPPVPRNAPEIHWFD